MKTCPFCRKQYTPKYPTKQAAFQTRDKEAREQWLSGCCSDACWDKCLPPEPVELDYPAKFDFQI